MIKFNKLFWQLNRIASAFAIFGLLLVISCSKDDDEPVSVATVQFTNEAQTVSENGAAVTINIPFDKAAGRAGTITVAVAEGTATEYGTHFTTSPNGTTGSFEIEVSKGQTSAQFTFTPINNALLADDKSVVFTISDVSSGFEIGTKDSNTITITDDEGPTQANFAVAASSTAENLTAGQDVTINLSSAAPGTGTVTVSFTSATAVYTTNFTTEPAATAGELEIPVALGATSITFKVKPVDDGSVNATRTITFTLAEASGAVVLGTAITGHTFTVTDNETPSAAVFNDDGSSVGEEVAPGIIIPLTLDPQTNGTGTVVVTFAGGTYGTDFTTDPAAVSGVITVPVASGVTAASFKVIPVDNAVAAAAKEVTFTLSGSTGIVTLGTGVTHVLTIEDDDAITTIADVRAAYSGTANITSSKRIRGVVTSSNPQVNTNNIWVQDATGGIVVRLVAANGNAIERGDEVSVQLNGGQYFEFNGLLQVQNVPNANVTIVNEGVTLPTPESITVAQLNSNAYEGKLVRITDVAFVDANGTATMSGTRVVSTGSVTTNIRTESGAPHAASVLPYGFGTITGLAGENLGAAQIIPVSFADDVFASSPAGTIGVTSSFTDFGSVNTGTESASQSYTVQGTSLTQDVVITASTGFKVSLIEAGPYGSTVTIPAATANTVTTVYVKFVPTVGGAQAGTVTHKSLGAAPAMANVAGTGVGLSPLQTLALWTFETTAPVLNNATAITNLLAEAGLQANVAVASGLHASADTDYSSPAGNGSSKSFSSNTWAIGDYYQFVASTTGFSDISITWDQTGSSTGPGDFTLQYSTDGTNFTTLPSYAIVKSTGSNIIYDDATTGGSWSTTKHASNTTLTYDLSAVTALNNTASVTFRITCATAPSAAGGTGRVDNVKVEGR